MTPLQQSLAEYHKQLKRGKIQAGYQGLMQYFRKLRTHMQLNHPRSSVSAIQFGLMDFSYFFYASPALAAHQLKIAVLFEHDSFSWELWLVGRNKKVQADYQRILAEKGWKKHALAETTEGVYHIVRQVLITQPDFGDLDRLTKRIDQGTLKFARDVEKTIGRD